MLAGVIYLHWTSDNRFGRMAGENFYMFRKLCGGSALKNVVLVTNRTSRLGAREEELASDFFRHALDKGARMVWHYNTAESAHDIIGRIVANRPVVLQIQRGPVDEHEDSIDATTGESINQELEEQTGRHQIELNELREEMKWKLEETKRNLEERMAMDYATEKERAEARVVEEEREARERERVNAELVDLNRRLQDVIDARAADQAILEREVMERGRAEAEYKRQLADLIRCIQDQTNAFAAYRASSEREMRELRDRMATAVTIPPPVSGRLTLCVKVAFCSAAHDG